MLGSLKKYSSVESPNFPHQKMKIFRLEFHFDKNMRPSMESQPRIILLMDYGERPKK